MKRVFVLLIALLIAFAIVGCNVAPNVPRVTPYATNGGNYYNNIQGGAYGPPAGANGIPGGAYGQSSRGNNMTGRTGGAGTNTIDGSRAYGNTGGT